MHFGWVHGLLRLMVRFCWLFVNVLCMGLLCFTLFVVLFVALVTCALRLGASFLLGLLVVFLCSVTHRGRRQVRGY